jgi:PKD repeat protein
MRWYMESAEYYRYNALGRNYSYWSAEYNPQLLRLLPVSRTELNYSNNNMILAEIHLSWNDFSGAWAPEFRYTYSYDEEGKMVAGTSYNWSMDVNGWEYFRSDSIFYTGTGRMSRMLSYSYQPAMQTWMPDMRQDYSYDVNDFLIRLNHYMWIDTSRVWENLRQVIYDNDETGRDTSRIESFWDGAVWRQQYQYVNQFDDAGNHVLEAEYYYDGEVWRGTSKTEYTYDPNNRRTLALNYQWDWYTWDWLMFDRYTLGRDGFGNLTEQTYAIWDTASQIFLYDWQDFYEYDYNVDMKNVAMPYWWGPGFVDETGIGFQDFNNKLVMITEHQWDGKNQNVDEVGRDSLHYSGLLNNPVNDASCNADFTSRLDTRDPLIAYFYDQSDTTVVSWYWMFGDGKTSTRRNPVHKYEKPGTYKVALTTVDQTGFCSNTHIEQIKVGNPPCNAAFTYTVDTLKRVVTLMSGSEGSGLSYFWNFGDGSVAKSINAVHEYDYPGSYPITLTVTNNLGDCMDKYTETIRVGAFTCNADFVVFVDSSTNRVFFRPKQVLRTNKYLWVLGDGTLANTPNYVHTFKSPGHYTAALIVSNPLANCVEKRRETILVGRQSAAGKAGFIYVAGDDNIVRFTNRSLGNELSYHWDFNDGEISKDKDPEHKYVLPGYYTVCLTVTTKDGLRNTHCEKIFAGQDTKNQCLARFDYFLYNEGLSIACKDRSFGYPDQFRWIYSDGWTATTRDVTWHTAEPAYVRIQQVIRNTTTGCRDNAFALVNMGAESRLKASFGYILDESGRKADTYPTDFVGVSLGDAGKLKWDFGDGKYDSTTLNPTHVYTAPGEYHVCLTITNTETGDVDEYCEWITVGPTFNEEIDELAVRIDAYPNPFSDITKIAVTLVENSAIELKLYDMMGRKVRTIARQKVLSGTHIFSLDGRNLENGNYYLILDTKLGRARKLISVIK